MTTPLSVIYGLSLDGVTHRYVGYTTRGTRWRLQRHLEDSRRLRGGNRALYRWVRRHGEDEVQATVLEAVTDVEQLAEREVWWIAELRLYAGDRHGGLNLTRGGDGTFGYRHTPEARAAITAAQRGRAYPERTVVAKTRRRARLRAHCRERGHERKEYDTTSGRRCVHCQTAPRGPSWNAGLAWSDESRARMSTATMGQVPWNRGRIATPAEVERNRLAQHAYWHVGRSVIKQGCVHCAVTTNDSPASAATG